MGKPAKHNPGKQSSNTTSEKSSTAFRWLWPLLLVIITWAIYSGSLNNELTTWDDKYYINENPFIRSTKSDSLKELFSLNAKEGGYIMGNYHPLTIASYALEYRKAYKPGPAPEIESRIFHVTNLAFHVLNTLLVYLFILLLSRHRIAAFITALLFAIHPMHVESVAWVSERKDVMFTFFYLASLCAYLKFSREQKGRIAWYLFALLLFLLSLLSKGMAVTLPVVMLLLDYLNERRLTARLLLEKIPFFVLSIIFGLIAIEAQKSAGAIGNFVTYTFFERILLSFYGIFLYLYKAIFPVNLSCFYSYPEKVNGHLPYFLYIFPVVIGGLAFLVYRSMKHSRIVVFGAMFFIVTIALVLQVLPVGGAIIAERYTYIPYIGIFFMLAMAIVKLMEKRQGTLRPALVTGLILASAILSYATIQRTKVWKDSVTLWTDAIEKDGRAPAAFNGRGDAYLMLKQYDKAIADFKQALTLQEKYHEAHYNLGLAYYYKELHADAIKEYNRAIEIKPDLAVAYFNRSGTYFTIQQYEPALRDALKAQELGHNVDPKYIEAIRMGLK